MLDLIITKFALVDFKQQEQHFIVKALGYGYLELVVYDFFQFIVISLLFIWAQINKDIIPQSKTFCGFLMKFNFKSLITFVFILLPYAYIIAGFFACLNNIWVYLYTIGNKRAIEYYNYLEEYNFFDFMIFQMPYLLLFFLSYLFFYKFYKVRKQNIS